MSKTKSMEKALIHTWVNKRLDQYSIEYGYENDMDENMTKALSSASKSGKSNIGTPDHNIKGVGVGRAIIIEDKWLNDKMISVRVDGKISESITAVKNFAINGTIHYARFLVNYGYDEVIAIGVTGEGSKENLNIKISAYYVFNEFDEPKKIGDFDDLDFLSDIDALFIESALNEEEKERIIFSRYKTLKKSAKELNEIMNKYHISPADRVIYVSGMLLAMQRNLISPSKLKGGKSEEDPEDMRDGVRVYKEIENYLRTRKIPSPKRLLMLQEYGILKSDFDRDKINNELGESVTRYIFSYIYKNVYQIANQTQIDSLGELFSEFLKYTVHNANENGKVLTPPYVTRMMSELAGINRNSKVLDICTGSGGFLVAAMDKMLEDCNNATIKSLETEIINSAIKKYPEKTEEEAVLKLKSDYGLEDNCSYRDMRKYEVKRYQLHGIEVDTKMYVLAASNMIMRGDGSSSIDKADAFNSKKLIKGEYDHLLINPDFTYKENGLPFFLVGMNALKTGGIGVVIIQDSAGSGKGIKTAKEILSKHTMLGSIKMPLDLFNPYAKVQTSIYIFKAGMAHDYSKDVSFIDFRFDGYKRTSRKISEIGDTHQLYRDIVNAFVNGKSYPNIDVIREQITESGMDWNYESHKKFDTVPQMSNFVMEVNSYLSKDIKSIINSNEFGGELQHIEVEEFLVDELFDVNSSKSYKNLTERDICSDSGKVPFISNISFNNGVKGYSNLEALNRGNVITISDTTDDNSVFYQLEPFIGFSHIQVLTHKEEKLKRFNKEIAQYIVSAIRNSKEGMFDYATKYNSDNIRRTIISLPVNSKKEIDCDYMEGLIRDITLSKLKALSNNISKTINDFSI